MTAPEPARSDLVLLREATERLAASLGRLDEAAVRGPSVLPGWTRGHVLSHLARNADGVRSLALSARSGASWGMYPSRDLRNADIDAGATRPAELVLLDATASSTKVVDDLASMPDEAWAASIVPFFPMATEPRVPAAELPLLRLREVEAHHVDLDVGYGYGDIPAVTQLSFLDQLPGRFGSSPLAPLTVRATDLDRTWTLGAGGGPTLEGPAAALMAWALGRSDGSGLVCSAGAVPASPGWG